MLQVATDFYLPHDIWITQVKLILLAPGEINPWQSFMIDDAVQGCVTPVLDLHLPWSKRNIYPGFYPFLQATCSGRLHVTERLLGEQKTEFN